jgi:hypothetical protein
VINFDTQRTIEFPTELGACALTLIADAGCEIVENGEVGTRINEQTLREHLSPPTGAADVVALIEDRTGSITDRVARAQLLNALNYWRRKRYG